MAHVMNLLLSEDAPPDIVAEFMDALTSRGFTAVPPHNWVKTRPTLEDGDRMAAWEGVLHVHEMDVDVTSEVIRTLTELNLTEEEPQEEEAMIVVLGAGSLAEPSASDLIAEVERRDPLLAEQLRQCLDGDDPPEAS